jgi:dihydropteroate synthase
LIGRGEPTVGAIAWRHRNGAIQLDRPRLIGILNVTPDSFSDGGQLVSVDDAVRHAELLVAEGADGLDVGGESTRPQGAEPVTLHEELRRVVPVVAALAHRLPTVPLSVDTSKAAVARAAIDAGAAIVNDVSGFRRDPAMADLCAGTGVGVVLMHSRGSVRDMGTYAQADYGPDIVAEVWSELEERVAEAQRAGLSPDAIVIDPGIGFAKRSQHSLAVLAGLRRLVARGYPVMVGVSRKRFIGELSGEAVPDRRAAGTAGVNCAALERGARLFRVHDVRINRQALDAAWAVIATDLLMAPLLP